VVHNFLPTQCYEQLQIYLDIFNHTNTAVKICDDFRAMGHSAEFVFALLAIA
jgi:hypothetical protein